MARATFVLLGCWAIVWGSLVLPSLWRQSAIERFSSHIVDGDPFKPEVLASFLPELDEIRSAPYCRPSAVRSAAILRLRMVEDAIAAGEQQLIDRGLLDLDLAIRSSLECSPADPFLWLVMFWVENTRNGFKPENFELLAMSYRLGPNEAWIALKRIPLATAVLQQLPPALLESVIAEFTGLVNSGYYLQLAQIFPKLSLETSKLVLERIRSINLRNREAFGKELYRLGYDVSIPGVATPDPRPWH